MRCLPLAPGPSDGRAPGIYEMARSQVQPARTGGGCWAYYACLSIALIYTTCTQQASLPVTYLVGFGHIFERWHTLHPARFTGEDQLKVVFALQASYEVVWAAGLELGSQCRPQLCARQLLVDPVSIAKAP